MASDTSTCREEGFLEKIQDGQDVLSLLRKTGWGLKNALLFVKCGRREKVHQSVVHRILYGVVWCGVVCVCAWCVCVCARAMS